MNRVGQFLLLLVFIALSAVSPSNGQPHRPTRSSAWEALLEADPSAADDPSIGWQERLVLFALNSEQARAYFRDGADPQSLILDNGRTLREYLDARLMPPAGVFVSLTTPCDLFRSDRVESNQTYSVRVRGDDLGKQGGSAAGCGIPDDAIGVLLNLRLQTQEGSARLKLWAADGPEPAESLVETADAVGPVQQRTVMLAPEAWEEGELLLRSDAAAAVRGEVAGYFRVLRLGDNPGGGVGLLIETPEETAVGDGALASNVTGSGVDDGEANTAVGFEALNLNTTGDNNTAVGSQAGKQNSTGQLNSFFGTAAGRDNSSGSSNSFFGAFAGSSNSVGEQNAFFGDSAGYLNSFGLANSFFGHQAGYSTSDGSSNSFVGASAGYANDTGFGNSFVGSNAGFSNTAGNYSSGLGLSAGFYNTEGSENTFVGSAAGISNTIESFNSFIGVWSNGTVGISNATAVGYRAQVSQSNSLVLGSIAGENNAADSVKVGIGTPTPQEALHVVRSDGTAMVKVEETSGTRANRVLFRLTNNGGPWFKLLNSATTKEWTFAMDAQDNFIFSLIGTGGSEFKIYKRGRVVMGPGGTSAFDLLPNGDLTIAGDLTAAGVTYVSDRSRKENFAAVDGRRILEQVASMEITRWNFKDDQSRRAHLGPMAQDFHAAFGLGADEKTISASDISGVALAAIQGLNSKLAEQEARLAVQDERIRQLEARLAEMETQNFRPRERQAEDAAPAAGASERFPD